MPVDYSIAARGAQANAAPDFANMLAQYQMMGLRAQQNEIAQQRCNNMAKTAAIKDLNKTIMQSKTRPQRVYIDPGIKSTFYQKK